MISADTPNFVGTSSPEWQADTEAPQAHVKSIPTFVRYWGRVTCFDGSAFHNATPYCEWGSSPSSGKCVASHLAVLSWECDDHADCGRDALRATAAPSLTRAERPPGQGAPKQRAALGDGLLDFLLGDGLRHGRAGRGAESRYEVTATAASGTLERGLAPRGERGRSRRWRGSRARSGAR